VIPVLATRHAGPAPRSPRREETIMISDLVIAFAIALLLTLLFTSVLGTSRAERT
jgi:hypothetical protein